MTRERLNIVSHPVGRRVRVSFHSDESSILSRLAVDCVVMEWQGDSRVRLWYETNPGSVWVGAYGMPWVLVDYGMETGVSRWVRWLRKFQ